MGYAALGLDGRKSYLKIKLGQDKEILSVSVSEEARV